VDGGIDALLRGDESALGTPAEDMTSLCAVSRLEVPTKVLTCFAMGGEMRDGICHAQAFDRIGELTRLGGFLGAGPSTVAADRCRELQTTAPSFRRWASLEEGATSAPTLSGCHAARALSRKTQRRKEMIPCTSKLSNSAFRLSEASVSPCGNCGAGTTLVAAEMVAATQEIGYMVLSASLFRQTAVVVMGIVVSAAIACQFGLLMGFVERKVVPWKGRM